ncbi:MAG: hypothetical protein IPP32_17705 [Bacteroidetes bacterium]|nr:hypothetical protein [Bacteroidota bacterium]
MVNIGILDYLHDSSTSAAYHTIFKSQDFYKFMSFQKQNFSAINTAQAQLNFLKRNNIHCVALSPSAKTPALLLKHASHSFMDKKSGEKFLVID